MARMAQFSDQFVFKFDHIAGFEPIVWIPQLAAPLQIYERRLLFAPDHGAFTFFHVPYHHADHWHPLYCVRHPGMHVTDGLLVLMVSTRFLTNA